MTFNERAEHDTIALSILGGLGLIMTFFACGGITLIKKMAAYTKAYAQIAPEPDLV